MFWSRHTNYFKNSFEHFSAKYIYAILSSWNPQRFHRISGHHADFGIGGWRGAAYRVSIELHELSVAAGAGFFIAEDPALAIAPKWRGQFLRILGHIPRERCCQIVAQAQPLLVIVLKGKHSSIGAILVWQKFPQRFRVFHKGLFHGFKAVGFVHTLDGSQHGAKAANFIRPHITKSLGHAGLGAESFL